MFDFDVIVVGAGPAGLIAAEQAAARGRRTLLLEKNRRPGAKILIAGGGRCNLCPNCDERGVVAAFGRQGPFLHSALAALGPKDVLALFAAEGVSTYIDDEGKIFPRSDRADDVLGVLLRRLERSGAVLVLNEDLQSIQRTEGGLRLTTAARTLSAESAVICTGGRSYPACGATGDGYAWAAALGHHIEPPRTALVPLQSSAAWVHALQGLVVTDTAVELKGPAAASLPPADRARLRQRGPLLFTHFGVSGPTAMNVSRFVGQPTEGAAWSLVCDLVPDAKSVALERQLQDEASAVGRSLAATTLTRWVPQRMARVLCDQCLGASPRLCELTRTQRQALVAAIKSLNVPIAGTLGFQKAEVTAGGIMLDEVDSRTMQSKLVPGLFFAGEVLDLDGPIGGYNFQAAFSTGWAAGNAA